MGKTYKGITKAHKISHFVCTHRNRSMVPRNAIQAYNFFLKINSILSGMAADPFSGNKAPKELEAITREASKALQNAGDGKWEDCEDSVTNMRLMVNDDDTFYALNMNKRFEELGSLLIEVEACVNECALQKLARRRHPRVQVSIDCPARVVNSGKVTKKPVEKKRILSVLDMI